MSFQLSERADYVVIVGLVGRPGSQQQHEPQKVAGVRVDVLFIFVSVEQELTQDPAHLHQQSDQLDQRVLVVVGFAYFFVRPEFLQESTRADRVTVILDQHRTKSMRRFFLTKGTARVLEHVPRPRQLENVPFSREPQQITGVQILLGVLYVIGGNEWVHLVQLQTQQSNEQIARRVAVLEPKSAVNTVHPPEHGVVKCE